MPFRRRRYQFIVMISGNLGYKRTVQDLPIFQKNVQLRISAYEKMAYQWAATISNSHLCCAFNVNNIDAGNSVSIFESFSNHYLGKQTWKTEFHFSENMHWVSRVKTSLPQVATSTKYLVIRSTIELSDPDRHHNLLVRAAFVFRFRNPDGALSSSAPSGSILYSKRLKTWADKGICNYFRSTLS